MSPFIRRKIYLAAFIATFVAGMLTAVFAIQRADKEASVADGNAVLANINQQLGYGPRYPGAAGHEKTQRFLMAEMERYTEKMAIQPFTFTAPDRQEYGLANIIGRFNPSEKQRIILATHYDSRRSADKDSEHTDQPVPGANDSASGTAVLLELAKILKKQPAKPGVGIDFVFFDGEEGDPTPGADHSKWEPLGSRHFAAHLGELYGSTKPKSALVLDMVCDKNLTIYKEQSSVQNAPVQTEMFWDIAQKVDGQVFDDRVRYNIRDDHTPLNQAGVPSVLVIDFDYPHFHTTQDTPDKCSAGSLETVARATLEYIYSIR